jgi:hypothetical protein
MTRNRADGPQTSLELLLAHPVSLVLDSVGVPTPAPTTDGAPPAVVGSGSRRPAGGHLARVIRLSHGHKSSFTHKQTDAYESYGNPQDARQVETLVVDAAPASAVPESRTREQQTTDPLENTSNQPHRRTLPRPEHHTCALETHQLLTSEEGRFFPYGARDLSADLTAIFSVGRRETPVFPVTRPETCQRTSREKVPPYADSLRIGPLVCEFSALRAERSRSRRWEKGDDL